MQRSAIPASVLVAETAGGPKSCTTAEVSCGGDTVGSICHFKFIKVVLAHILGNLGTCTVLLSVYSGTCQHFFEIIINY